VGESSMGLCPGEQITLEAALYGLLLASGNDAAMTIARNLSRTSRRHTGSCSQPLRQTDEPRGTAPRIGTDHLPQSARTRSGRSCDDSTRPRAPHRAILQRPELRRILQTPSYDDGVHAVQTTNRLLGRYPGLIGGKTGITEAAGYSVIEAAERDGRTVIVVVLGSTRDAWYADAVQLLDYAFAQLAPAPAAGLAGSAAAASERDISARRPIGDAAMTVGGPRALILEASTPLPASNELWFWPASAVTTAVAAGVLASGFPAIMAVVIARRRAGRRATLDRGQRRGRRLARTVSDQRE
jgi:D-alanyl-D-alanine carboxypeptidase (penicillin-binding protein 5/6)